MHFNFLKSYQWTKLQELWALGPYTGIQLLSMFIWTFSFPTFIVSEKSVTKIFKNGNIWKPIKEHNSKSYAPLATILPLHLPYLRDQVWYKVHWSRTHWSRTTNIKLFSKMHFKVWLPRDLTLRVMGPWPLFCDYTLLTLETKCSISFIEVELQT